MESYSAIWGHIILFVLHCTYVYTCFTSKHVFLARSDETHTNFTLLRMSGLAVGHYLLSAIIYELTVSVKYATSPPAGGEWRKCDGAVITKDFPGMYKWLFRAEDYFDLVPGFADSLNAQLSMSFSGE